MSYLALYPLQIILYLNFHIHLNDWNKACLYLEKLQKINNNSDTHKLGLFIIQEGRMLQNEGKFDLARNKFEKALSIHPDLSAAYYFIAETYSKESEKYFQKTENIDDKYSDTYKEN